MFKRKTVFVLGAGASWHYGYPTGDKLVEQVRDAAKKFAIHCRSMAKQRGTNPPKMFAELSGNADDESIIWRVAEDNFEEFYRRIRNGDPTVIDYFLGQNLDLSDLGKFLIAWVILSCEQDYMMRGNRTNREFGIAPLKILPNDNWMRMIIHQICMGYSEDSPLSGNSVHFVTFNYDHSLEHCLLSGLRARSAIIHAHIDEFMADNRVVHVYGSVKEFWKNNKGTSLQFGNFAERPDHDRNILAQDNFHNLIDRVKEASRGINVIDPDTKDNLTEKIQAARNILYNSDRIYILGYGFDANNNERIELTDLPRVRSSPKEIYFTNYGDSNRINKAASTLFFGDSIRFLSPGGSPTASNTNFKIEKSTKNVYDALALDFDDFA